MILVDIAPPPLLASFCRILRRDKRADFIPEPRALLALGSDFQRLVLGSLTRERRLAGESAVHGFASRACEPGRCRRKVAGA